MKAKNRDDVGDEQQADCLPLNPSNPDDRMTLFNNHPVITRKFHIATPPICRAFDSAVQTIASGAPCCAYTAYPRSGKTWAANYFGSRLAEAFPDTPVFKFHAHHETPQRRRFCTDLLRQTRSGIVPDKKADPTDQVVNAWWAAAQDMRSGRLILIGDEMQCLTLEAFSWLIDITNDLEDYGVRTVCVFFAQPELRAKKVTCAQAYRTDIIGRFMLKIEAFAGITSSLELRSVMEAYDDPREFEYPKNSGWSFTRFFLPKAYADGWRLASCAGECWEQFQALALERENARGKLRPLNVGMQWIASTITRVLIHFSDFDNANVKVSGEMWRACIVESGFLESLDLVYKAT